MADRIGQQLDKYRITRLLGRGGFADVYLGEHIYLKTPAAIKILQTRLSGSDDLESFLKEARFIAQLSHPHIVRFLSLPLYCMSNKLLMPYSTHTAKNSSIEISNQKTCSWGDATMFC
jgi:serine/threonine protein kinase